MSKMYKPDPNQPRTEAVSIDKATSDGKVVELENKVRRLTEQLTKMQAEIDRLTRAVKRQGSDVNGVIGRLNRVN
jgi:molecular chaperone GrpE (heat shock protein)